MKQLEQFTKYILLKILLLFSHQKKINRNIKFNEDSRILFIRLNRIGDALITTPLIHEIKKQLKCTIFILADKKNSFIFENNPSVDYIIDHQKGLKGLNKIRNYIKVNKIDTIVDLHDDVSTSVSFILAFSKVSNKFGLKKSNFKIYTDTIERLNPINTHIAGRILELSRLFKINVNKSETSIHYYPHKESIESAEKWIKETYPNKRFLLGINISAGDKARFWGIDNFRMLLDEIRLLNLECMLFSTPEDSELAKKISDEKYIYPANNDFNFFAEGILHLDLLFSPDTSAIQIAAIKSIPVFGLYVMYNTNNMIWSPYHTEYNCVITNEPTLENVTFEEVKKKFIPFLTNKINE